MWLQSLDYKSCCMANSLSEPFVFRSLRGTICDFSIKSFCTPLFQVFIPLFVHVWSTAEPTWTQKIWCRQTWSKWRCSVRFTTQMIRLCLIVNNICRIEWHREAPSSGTWALSLLLYSTHTLKAAGSISRWWLKCCSSVSTAGIHKLRQQQPDDCRWQQRYDRSLNSVHACSPQDFLLYV